MSYAIKSYQLLVEALCIIGRLRLFGISLS